MQPTGRTLGPIEGLKKATAELEKVLRRRYPDWSPEADPQKSAVHRAVGELLDYQEFASRALGVRWNQLRPKEQQEFVAILGEMVPMNLVHQQAESGTEYHVEFEREKVAGNEAQVSGHLTRTADDKKERVGVEYRLVRRDGRWCLFDIVTNGDSLLDAYRWQFEKILARESMQGLLERMRSKIRKSGQ